MRIGEVIERSPIKGFHYAILAACFIGWMFDAMNSGLISFVLKPLTVEFNLDPHITGLMLSAWLMGMLLGGVLLGTIADYVGRKPTIATAMVLYSVPAGLSGLAQGWWQIFVLRFLAGIGASGFMVVTSTLLSEYVPVGNRGRFVAFLESAWAFGWLLGASLSLLLAPRYGWRGVILTGFVPIAAILIFWAVVPESLRYLGERGRRSEAISILREKGLIAPGEERVLELTGSKKAKVTIAELWSPGYRKRTAMLWIHWFCIVLTYWGIFLWAPYILEADRGISLVRTIKYTLLMTTMQIPGYWSGAFLIERVGRKRLLALYMALAGVGSLLFSVASTDLEALLWGSVISFFNLGAWGITYAYTPELYPTYMRGTGAGWANSVGRVGGILGPIIVGFLLKISGSKYLIFLLFALLHFLSSTDVLALGVETKGRPLE